MNDLKKQILEGIVFIYSIDTIYWLSYKVLNLGAINSLKEINKIDSNKYLSVIVHPVNWFEENFIGIMIPDSELSRGIQEIEFLFITNFVNLNKWYSVCNLDDIFNEIIIDVNIILDERRLPGRCSTKIINGDEAKR